MPALVRDRLDLVLGLFNHLTKFLVDLFEFLIRSIVEIDHHIPGVLVRADQLIDLKMKRPAVAVLRVLNEKHHEKCDDGGTRVDDQLPGVGVMKRGPEEGPRDDNNDGETKSDRRTGNG